MKYNKAAIQEAAIPQASLPTFQHVVDTYVSETNKVVEVWSQFGDLELAWKPDEKSTTVGSILAHQLLSERRFFAEFIGTTEPDPMLLTPPQYSVEAFTQRYVQLVRARLPKLAHQSEQWWLEIVPFFDVQRERIWIFWRRVLHTAHHRTQLMVYLRLLGKPVPSVYGPSADSTWEGADPTNTVEAAGRG